VDRKADVIFRPSSSPGSFLAIISLKRCLVNLFWLTTNEDELIVYITSEIKVNVLQFCAFLFD